MKDRASEIRPYVVIIPLDRATVNRFSRRDLETFAKVQFSRELPQGMTISGGASFTFALAENRMAQTSWTHVMRVSAPVERTRPVAVA